MAVLTVQIEAPEGYIHVAAALDGGVVAETACVCSSVAPATIRYAIGGSDDGIPALNVATVYGDSATTFSRDEGPWVLVTVRASLQLQVVQEVLLDSVTEDHARLARVTRLTIQPYQQS